MTRVAIWCRHSDDNIIGIDAQIPWSNKRDKEMFYNIINGNNIVCGKKTYESIPLENFLDNNIFVLTKNADYQVASPDTHFVCNNYKELNTKEEDIYIIGGASTYKLFFENMPPEIVVDSIYHGKLDNISGKKIDINDCIEIMQKKYSKVFSAKIDKEVETNIYIKKGDFVPFEKIREIIEKITNPNDKED